MKKFTQAVSAAFVWIVVIIAVAMMIFTVISVNTFNRGDRDIFGFKAFIVLSDSMSATDFSAGDLVLVRDADPNTLQPGDIITYQSQNNHNFGENVTHKIRSRTVTKDGAPGFITYGTTTNTDDEAIVTYPYIQGKYVASLPKVGSFFQFVRSPQGYIICILLPFLFLIIHQGIICLKNFRRYKAEQMAELQAEKAALEAERKKSEAMMQQLLQMQSQMQQSPVQAAPPKQEPEELDINAVLAELEALRAQVSGKDESNG